jgi:hypothetical protein
VREEKGSFSVWAVMQDHHQRDQDHHHQLTSRDEDKVSTLEHLPQGLLGLECSLLAKKGVASAAQPTGELGTDLDLVEGLVRGEGLW